MILQDQIQDKQNNLLLSDCLRDFGKIHCSQWDRDHKTGMWPSCYYEVLKAREMVSESLISTSETK